MYNEEDLKINIKDYKYLSTFSEISSNSFDITWCFDSEYFNKNSNNLIEISDKTYTKIPIENILEKYSKDNSVIYKYNNDFFRSDNFISQHNEKHILFAGCSETEGVGGNIEDSWPYILYEKIKSSTGCSGFFNLGRSGYGWQKIINNCLIYFKRYGAPDFLFILLPNSGRGYYWSEMQNMIRYWQRYPSCNYEPNNLDDKLDLNIKQSKAEYLKSFIDFIVAWNSFIFICDQLNIKLFFSTWADEDAINIENNNIFKNYVPGLSNKDAFMKYLKSFLIYNPEKQNMKYLIEKRDGHQGYAKHSFWAEKFYDFYINSIVV